MKKDRRYLWVLEGAMDQDNPDDWVPDLDVYSSMKHANESCSGLMSHNKTLDPKDRIYWRVRKYVPFIEK